MCWINRHKEFWLHLNNWLARFHEQKEVSSLYPSSPINILTPNTFRICSELLSAFKNVSEVEVSLRFKHFTLILHQLRKYLTEEGRHRLKLQYLSNHHEEKFKRLCMDYGFDWDQYGVFLKEGNLAEVVPGNPRLDNMYANLRPVRDKLQEATERHKVAVEQLNDAASRILGEGLIPVLEAFFFF